MGEYIKYNLSTARSEVKTLNPERVKVYCVSTSRQRGPLNKSTARLLVENTESRLGQTVEHCTNVSL